MEAINIAEYWFWDEITRETQGKISIYTYHTRNMQERLFSLSRLFITCADIFQWYLEQNDVNATHLSRDYQACSINNIVTV